MPVITLPAGNPEALQALRDMLDAFIDESKASGMAVDASSARGILTRSLSVQIARAEEPSTQHLVEDLNDAVKLFNTAVSNLNDHPTDEFKIEAQVTIRHHMAGDLPLLTAEVYKRVR